MNDNVVGKNLMGFFREQGIKQKDVAKALGITKIYFSYILNGKRTMSRPVAESLSALYGFSLVWLVTGEGYMFDDKPKNILEDIDNRVARLQQIDLHIERLRTEQAELNTEITILCEKYGLVRPIIANNMQTS